MNRYMSVLFNATLVDQLVRGCKGSEYDVLDRDLNLITKEEKVGI